MLAELLLAFQASSDVNDREGANQRTKKLKMISSNDLADLLFNEDELSQ